VWRVRVAIVAVQTQQCVGIVELHVTVNRMKILIVAQQRFYWRVNVAGNNKSYLGLHVKCPISLSNFNKIWSLWTDFHENPEQNFTEIRPARAAVLTEACVGAYVVCDGSWYRYVVMVTSIKFHENPFSSFALV
jgi:hypothetical protein